jgi:hypothetical protein
MQAKIRTEKEKAVWLLYITVDIIGVRQKWTQAGGYGRLARSAFAAEYCDLHVAQLRPRMSLSGG